MGVLTIASLLALIVQATSGYSIYNQAPDRQNQWFMIHEDNSAHSANHAYTRYPISDKPPTESKVQPHTYNPNLIPTAKFENIFDKFQKVLTENRHINFDNPHTRPQKINQNVYNYQDNFEDAYSRGLYSNGYQGSQDDERSYNDDNKYNDEMYNQNTNENGYDSDYDGYNHELKPMGNDGMQNQYEDMYHGYDIPKLHHQTNEEYNSYNNKYNNENPDVRNIFSKGYKSAYGEDRFNVNSDNEELKKPNQRDEEYNQSGEVYKRNMFHNENDEKDIEDVTYNQYSKNKLPGYFYNNYKEDKTSFAQNTFSTPVRSSKKLFDEEENNENIDYKITSNYERKEYEDSGESYGISHEDELRYNEQAEKAVESLYNKNISQYEDSTNDASNHVPFKSHVGVSFKQDDEDAAEVHYHQHKHMHKHKHTQDHKHEHDQSHIHAHISKNQHVHKNKEEHEHEHHDTHKHAHKHMQQHKHSHLDEHKHDHAHKHAHKEAHKHAHIEDHKHGNNHHHGHDHKHDHHGEHKHDHHHGHTHSHLDEHKHDHHHGHKHGHKHGNKHGHKHDHKHGHGNKHWHDHGHIHKKRH